MNWITLSNGIYLNLNQVVKATVMTKNDGAGYDVILRMVDGTGPLFTGADAVAIVNALSKVAMS